MAGLPLLHKAVKDRNVNLVKMTLVQNASVNETFGGYTPLNFAIQKYRPVHAEIVELLLIAGADPNSKDSSGQTPLHVIPWRYVQNDLRPAELLLAAGAGVNARDKQGKTPLHTAAFVNWIELVELLLNHNAEVDVKNNEGANPFLHTFIDAIPNNDYFKVRKLLIDHGSDVNCTDDEGKTALHKLYLRKDIKLIRYLYRSGANFNVQDLSGRTPLMFMLNAEVISFERYLLSIDEDLLLVDEEDEVFEPVLVLPFMLECTDINLLENSEKSILDFSPKSMIWCSVILQHIAKLKVIGLSVRESIINTIFENEDFNNYFEKCVRELKIAKNTRLQDSWVTFFNLLVDDRSKLIKYAGNKVSVKDFENYDIKKKFPIYGEFMIEYFSKAIEERRIWDDASVILGDSLPVFNPTHLIIRSILDILTIKDLKKICK